MPAEDDACRDTLPLPQSYTMGDSHAMAIATDHTTVSRGSTATATAGETKRRAPIACRRCRRLRSRCIHNKAQPPCRACHEAGVTAEECTFPVRGQPDEDRASRHPRRTGKVSRSSAEVRKRILQDPRSDRWDELPPLEDLVDGITRFPHHYFPYGFIQKQELALRLRKDHQSMSFFLVVSILSISAHLTPALATHYGSSIKAAEFFMKRAAQCANSEIYREPTLERC